MVEVKSSKPVSVSFAKEVLSERGKEGELGYEQSQALEHGERFAHYESADVKKLVASIAKNEKISEELAIKIVDIRPNDPSTLKAILIKDRIELSEEEIAQIIKELS